MKVTVVKHTGSKYLVSNLPEWKPFVCTVRGKLRIKESDTTNPISVGDLVEVLVSDSGEGVIEKVYERKNYIIRKSTNLSKQSHIIASNLDMVVLIVTIEMPELKSAFVDRFLATCEAYRVPVTIVVNKFDLYTDKSIYKAQEFIDKYRSIGYCVLDISAKSLMNVSKIKEICKDKITLFSGQSGTGKSTLINALNPSLSTRIGEISDYHKQGKHTTTYYEMFPLTGGGFIIDTPGIKGFGLIDIEKEELSHYFREMLPPVEMCKFKPCTHTHEPDCAIKQAVEEGKIYFERYESYLSMLEEEEKYR